jgi:hypothetical protein
MGAVGWCVRGEFAVHREWWTSSLPMIASKEVTDPVEAFE